MKLSSSLVTGPIKSSFLNAQKDAEMILKKLFIETRPYSDELKSLLVINTPDCLKYKSNQLYLDKINSLSLKGLIDGQYIKLAPKFKRMEHEEEKSYIILSFDNYVQSVNPEFRNCTINFDIICPTEQWDLGDFQVRPLKIAGYIDGILNKSKLSGIGELEFIGCQELIISPEFAGYTLTYRATHGSDDLIEVRS